MGTLPPNFAFEDPARFPAARMVELCRNTAAGANNTAGPPPAVTIPRYEAPIGIWDIARNDYGVTSSGRGNAWTGSGPYLPGVASDGIIHVAAPGDRPLPFVVWANFMFCNMNVAGAILAAGQHGARFGINRSIAGETLVERRCLANAELDKVYPATFEYQTRQMFGFDVVPPGRTYQLWVGWDGDLFIFQEAVDNLTTTGTNRNRFGVMTF